MNTHAPKWATPERQAHLIDLFYRSGGMCVFGHKPCLNPDHHYINFIDDLIKDWVSDDRQQRSALLRENQRYMHNLNECGKLGGKFDCIAREIYHNQKPEYYIEGIGYSVIEAKPFVKIRLSSSLVRLHVYIDKLMSMSKNRKRKIKRHGRIPTYVWSEIDHNCRLAIARYLA